MAPVRKLLPPMGGLDFSPILVFILINIAQIIIQRMAAAVGVLGSTAVLATPGVLNLIDPSKDVGVLAMGWFILAFVPLAYAAGGFVLGLGLLLLAVRPPRRGLAAAVRPLRTGTRG